MARIRKRSAIYKDIKDQEKFPHACTGYLWRSKSEKKRKNKGKK